MPLTSYYNYFSVLLLYIQFYLYHQFFYSNIRSNFLLEVLAFQFPQKNFFVYLLISYLFSLMFFCLASANNNNRPMLVRPTIISFYSSSSIKSCSSSFPYCFRSLLVDRFIYCFQSIQPYSFLCFHIAILKY